MKIELTIEAEAVASQGRTGINIDVYGIRVDGERVNGLIAGMIDDLIVELKREAIIEDMPTDVEIRAAIWEQKYDEKREAL